MNDLQEYLDSKQRQLDNFKDYLLYHWNSYDHKDRQELLEEIDENQQGIDTLRELDYAGHN